MGLMLRRTHCRIHLWLPTTRVSLSAKWGRPIHFNFLEITVPSAQATAFKEVSLLSPPMIVTGRESGGYDHSLGIEFDAV